jgi:magnesium chelatase family protein
VLEVMRQPLEDGTVCIARAAMSLTFPARFMLAAAMNPCPCGFFNDRSRECRCTQPMIQRYMQKISGPLMDRIDIHIDVPAVNYKEMRSTSEPEGSGQIRERVMRAREIQLRRFGRSTVVQVSNEKVMPPDTSVVRSAEGSLRACKTYCNAQMTPRQIRAFCELTPDCERLLERAMMQQGLTARAHDRILKVARTIADLEGAQGIQPKHIAEAIQYRTLDRTFWA